MKSLTEIIEKFQKQTIHETRSKHSEYFEAVIYNKDIDQWGKILTDTLGPPIKPTGVEPSEEDLKITKQSGGIRANQTLFSKSFEHSSVIAKFWPWEDNTHTTLKMALLVN